jgi:hypothetical protein
MLEWLSHRKKRNNAGLNVFRGSNKPDMGRITLGQHSLVKEHLPDIHPKKTGRHLTVAIPALCPHRSSVTF